MAVGATPGYKNRCLRLWSLGGNMALIVRVYINNKHISTESAVRVKGGTDPDDINTYRLGTNGKLIKHRYGDGCVALAEKMMRNLKKQENDYGLLAHRKPL